MNKIYRAIGTSKQNMHQRLERDMNQLEEREQLREIVGQVRQDHPGMGAESLYMKLKPKIMGRDRFYAWYRENGLTIKPRKNWRRTTDSSGVIRFSNLIDGIELTGVNQVWVSDITYFEIDNEFYYLTLVMDQHSRMIKGFHASRSLRTDHTTIPALKMAMRHLQPGEKPIIHSDGGGQYYSKSFRSLIQGKLISSMGKSAYENPHAERLNKTVKNSYLIPYRPANFEQLKALLDKASRMYNEGKPHKGLKGMSPTQFENQILMSN